MSETESTPKRTVPRPIKASEVAAKSEESRATESPAKGNRERRGKRKGRQEQQEAQPKSNPALMRGPRPVKPQAEPEPMPEDPSSEAAETAETAELESSVESDDTAEATSADSVPES
jgi:hypothetical protein